MRPRHIALIIGLSLTACTQAGAANDGKLGELSQQLSEANAKLGEVETRLGAIEEKLAAAEAERAAILEKVDRRRGPPPPPPGPGIDPEKLEAGISCNADRCTLERKLIDDILNTPQALVRQARVVPAMKDGETKGFKLYGLRPGSMLKKLSFENGDMITSVNGKGLASPEAAMETFTELKDTKKLEVAYERRGESKTLTIEIK